jgi:hypothetical protein
VTPDAATARWAAARVDLGCGTFQAHVVGPDGIPVITDVEHTIREPQLSLLSVMAHGRGDVALAVQIATAAAAATKRLTEDQQLLYSRLIDSALSEAARKAFEMLPQAHEFFSESQRRVFAEGKIEGKIEGKVEGKAEGAAQAILLVLTTRARSPMPSASVSRPAPTSMSSTAGSRARSPWLRPKTCLREVRAGWRGRARRRSCVNSAGAAGT